MPPLLRLSGPAIRVLEALLADSRWTYGYDLMRATGIQAGTLYPLLIRLADAGWLTATWEERAEGGRPPRHLYRLSANGRKSAEEYLERARSRGWLTALGERPV